jgi:hypothetical protein
MALTLDAPTGISSGTSAVRIVASFGSVDPLLVPLLWRYNRTQWVVTGPAGTTLPTTCGLSSTCWLSSVEAVGNYTVTASVQLLADAFAATPSYSCPRCVYTAAATFFKSSVTLVAGASVGVGRVRVTCNASTGVQSADVAQVRYGFLVLSPASAVVTTSAVVPSAANVTGLVLGQPLVRASAGQLLAAICELFFMLAGTSLFALAWRWCLK